MHGLTEYIRVDMYIAIRYVDPAFASRGNIKLIEKKINNDIRNNNENSLQKL